MSMVESRNDMIMNDIFLEKVTKRIQLHEERQVTDSQIEEALKKQLVEVQMRIMKRDAVLQELRSLQCEQLV